MADSSLYLKEPLKLDSSMVYKSDEAVREAMLEAYPTPGTNRSKNLTPKCGRYHGEIEQ